MLMQTANEPIINVQEIEPRLRHQTIFKVFNTLLEGESLRIHNNHDPMPVYYQLVDLRGNIFTWEYLQKGPEWWDIRVTRVVPILPTENNDFILNIPAIEPKQKHATIFHVFENMPEEESFIIHNDHDPKPVYYQLVDKHGEIFNWDYLQQGPNWWSIRVTKNTSTKNNKIPIQSNVAVETNQQQYPNETVINVPSLEPRLKHPTIFNTFESLQPGQSFIIHNDHDPKPVFYQLKSEHGDVFTWEYLQQGPAWWDIRVTRKVEQNEETIGQIVAKDIRKAEVLKKYGIDFCCGGKKTVREVCAEKGIDANEVERELLKTTQNISIGNNLNYDEWNLDFLADYVVNTHHNFVRKYLPEIKGYAIKVAQVHGGRHPELLEIKELVEDVYNELMEHMVDEENKLFPLIKEIVKAKNNNTAYKKEVSFKDMVAATEAEHDSVGRAMEEIRRLSDNYAIPDDACTSYKLLFKLLQDFENDLFVHIHLENNILFSKAIEIEKTLA